MIINQVFKISRYSENESVVPRCRIYWGCCKKNLDVSRQRWEYVTRLTNVTFGNLALAVWTLAT